MGTGCQLKIATAILVSFLKLNIFTDVFSTFKTAIFIDINRISYKFTIDVSALCDLIITSGYRCSLVYGLVIH